MADDKRYKEAIQRVKNGRGDSEDYLLTKRAANSHRFHLQREAKESLGLR